ncbi:NAD(P)-dependent oxidoreductase [Ktedonosporobacter rubrisoli]|uniref:NAD(P)-dependent oxidoreductase n=1 Tax=Ktedonosporobacter rubrisoli TaxID=2509675 RepID=A0A4P6JY41_KTERU|nr:NAD(P)-dependent oxidoreductase [Ktedonosporobacter rubrisoli]QBD80708.1 NAD(P)-dependent oxidoreductase [Ktedonosporobacter rubrisoli]
MSETLGFIGLGRLGLPSAANLLSSGYALRVYNRTASKAEPLLAKGAQLASRPAEVVTPGGIVITLVWDDAAVESVVMSEGFLEQLGPGGIHVGMSTIAPETSRKLAAMHAEHGSTYLDAPIFGTPESANSRTLWIPLSGPKPAKERVRPILQAMGGQGIVDFGEEVGAGNIVKIVGNFLIMSAGLSLHEALSMAQHNGVDPKAVFEMLTTSPALFPAPIYQRHGKYMVENLDQRPYAGSQIPLKDVGLFKESARQTESSAAIADLLLNLLQGEQADK